MSSFLLAIFNIRVLTTVALVAPVATVIPSVTLTSCIDTNVVVTLELIRLAGNGTLKKGKMSQKLSQIQEQLCYQARVTQKRL